MAVGHLKSRWLWTSLIISGVLASDWVVHFPEIPVLAPRGSSVTVNCSYDFPEDPVEGKPHKVLSEMWCRNQSFCITPTYVYHSHGIFPDPAFQGRVRYLGTTGSKNCSFRISDLRASDSGVYVFRFITDHPVKKLPGQKGFLLQVKDAPVNTSVIVTRSGEIVEGTSLTLTCTSHADPPVRNFTWFKTRGPRTSFKGSGQKLIIESLRAEDSGLYTCVARNNLGLQEAAVEITVHKREDDGGLSIAGIVVGVVLTLIAIVFIAVCVRRHKRSRSLHTASNGDGVL